MQSNCCDRVNFSGGGRFAALLATRLVTKIPNFMAQAPPF